LLLRISPDGSKVAAVATTAPGVPELLVFSLDGGEVTHTPAESLAGVQELAWSPDGNLLAVVRPMGAVILDAGSGSFAVVADYEATGRLFGPLGGDIWAPDSSAVALGVSEGIVVLRPGEEAATLAYGVTPFSQRSAAYAGWLDDRILVRDFATEVFYSRAATAAGDGGWIATIPADPQAAFVGALERAAGALNALVPSATLAVTRPTADRGGVIVSGWKPASDDAIRRGPFLSAVAVAPLEGEPLAFDLGKVASLGAVNEGRLVDAVLVR
jgi:hypothetical protein